MSGSISGVSVQAADSHKSLITDVQFYEMYTSTALNRKFKNIIKPGVYSGFNVVPGVGLKLVVTSGDGVGAASIDFENIQLSVQQHTDIEVEVPAGTTTIIALQGFYKFGVKTSQVSQESTVNAAEIVTVTDQQLKDGQIELCRVVVPAGATQITPDMIDTSSREYRSLGLQLSAELDSEEEGVAANSLAIKRAISFLLGDGVPEALATLSQLAAAINNDDNFAQTVNKALDLKAPLASPALTGTPTVPTAAKTDNSTKIASTAFVQTLLSALQSTINDSLALKAPLANPALTGTPTAPTAAQTVNNTQVATTAFVKAAIAALVDSSPAALDTLNELAEALGNDPHFATTVTNALAGKQPLNSTLTDLSGKTVAGLLEYLGLGAGAFGLKNCVVFNAAGVSNWSVPDELRKGRKAKVTVIGGGGSGGRNEAGGGGGGGGKATKLVDLLGVTSVSITVGEGGIAPEAGKANALGTAGKTSSFGIYVSATGGSAGGTPSGGMGGKGTGGDINTSLGPGTPGAGVSTNRYCSGTGGGPGGPGAYSSTQAYGADAIGPGGGGGGACVDTVTPVAVKAGNGADGMVIIEW